MRDAAHGYPRGGLAAHFLWFIAVVVAVFWVAGFAFRSGEGRWYGR